jgi:NAD(P)-dependent dehydrogenase (short-subunit alcohol dehydrogenase family)
MESSVFDIFESLRGRGAVVVGGATPLGRAIADGLRRVGSTVVVIDAAPAAEAYAELPGIGQPAFVKADIRDPEQVEAAYQHVDELVDRLAAVVNIAEASSEQRPAEDLPDDHWHDMLDRKLNGIFWSCQQAARRMLPTGHGSIVNFSSLAGVLIDKYDQRVHHHAANSAVNTLGQGLAVEWAGRGVRVNAIGLGALRSAGNAGTRLDDEDRITASVPMQRLGSLAEIVPIALFLCSDASSYITGQTLVADGGRGLLFD